jgi:DNA ligase-3
MSDHLNKGDVAETLRHFFAKSEDVAPSKTSTLTLAQVDTYLTKLTQVSGDEQIRALTSLVRKCTRNDLRMFIRLVKKDLRINAGTKVIMDALGPNAYQAFQVSRDLKDVVARVDKLDSNGKPGMKKDLSIKVNLMTAVKPMLADACKSVERAFQKCPNGLYAEIKYDGERLQVHKNNAKFSYYSRNLKEVQAHKVEHLKEYIPKAFATASQLILDGEILLYCNETKKPLPFGTLGVHKKNKFTTATVCYVVFDCLHINGKDLTNTPLAERRRLLVENMEEIPGRIMLSEQHLFKKPAALRELMMNVIEEGLEGLVCKDTQGKYEPGKRHWLKMKRDYLEDGSMADTADLVVLGAYYGTGNKGGMRSVFLMGCLCEKTGKWYTVTKVGNGLDDAALEKMQKKIDMVEIKKRPEAVPSWLVVNRSLVPDFVVKDPKKSMVWELTGAEFSKSDSHTADGISIRFPRITKVRDDKSWKEATSLQRLKKLVATSKEKSDLIDSSSPSKRKSTEAERNDSDEDDDIKEVKEVKKFKTASASTSTASSSKKKSTLDEDDDESSKKKSSKKQQSDDLPSLFNGKTFYFCEDVPNTADLFRYVN